jgi:AraC-like DNA-binding protein
MKCTPTQYINQKKIERAQVMLIIDDLPIKEIAYNLSFDNISYFNKLFKSLTGLTPGEYKKGLHV